MQLIRTYGRGNVTFNIDDLDNNTKLILLYSNSASSARSTALSVRDNLKNTNYIGIDSVIATMESNYQISYYDIVTSDTPSGTRQITSGSSYLYLSIVVCSKTNGYIYSGTYASASIFSQKESRADENEDYYITSDLDSGTDFTIDVSIMNTAMGYVFANTMGANSVMYFQFAGTVTPTVDIETDLTNCDIDKITVDADTPTLLTLTTDTIQYLFFDVPTITINGVSHDFTVSQDKLTATYTLTASENDVVSVTANAVFKYVSITGNLNNCSINVNSVEIGNTQTIVLTADSNLGFYITPTITVNGVSHDFTVSQDKLTATYSYTAVRGDVVSVDATATGTPKTAVINKDVSNVDVSPDVDAYTEYSDLTFIFTCGEYYSFDDVPYIQTNIYSGATETIQAVKINDFEYRLTMPKNSFIDIAGLVYHIVVYASATFNTETVNKYGLICLYKPSKQNMIDLSKERFVTIGETDTTEDLGKYITSLKRIYLNVSTVGLTNIVLGNTRLHTQAYLIDNDDVVVDLGNATIQGLYGNELDIKHGSIELVLPFVGIVSLDSNVVMNKTINIKYRCNLITGVCIAYVYLVETVGETETLTLLNKYSGIVGFDVPYILKPNNETVVNNSNVDSSNIFIAEPKINVYMNKKADNNNSVYDTFYIDTIANIESGFVTVNKIISTDNSKIILDSESRMIESVLKTGFII